MGQHVTSSRPWTAQVQKRGHPACIIKSNHSFAFAPESKSDRLVVLDEIRTSNGVHKWEVWASAGKTSAYVSLCSGHCERRANLSFKTRVLLVVHASRYGERMPS
eukprot:6210045-Pleurochrysis_carterae.AAC.4